MIEHSITRSFLVIGWMQKKAQEGRRGRMGSGLGRRDIRPRHLLESAQKAAWRTDKRQNSGSTYFVFWTVTFPDFCRLTPRYVGAILLPYEAWIQKFA